MEEPSEKRTRLTRERVLQLAVDLADEIGIEALTMRRLAEELGVVPMALYKHVANREELLDGMVDTIVAQIEPVSADGHDDGDGGWRVMVRAQVLAARRLFQRHPWSRRVVESRTTKTPAVLDYLERFTGLLLAGGFSVDLTHHVMHAIGGRMWGFTQELFDEAPDGPDARTAPDPALDPAVQAAMLQAAAARYPNIVAVATATPHDPDSVVGRGCDDESEFAFALDLLLDGIERRRAENWSSTLS